MIVQASRLWLLPDWLTDENAPFVWMLLPLPQMLLSFLQPLSWKLRPLKWLLEKVIKQTVPLAVTQSEQILAIREWASLRAVSAARQEDLKEYQSIQLKKDDENPRDKDADLHTSRGGRAVEF